MGPIRSSPEGVRLGAGVKPAAERFRRCGPGFGRRLQPTRARLGTRLRRTRERLGARLRSARERVGAGFGGSLYRWICSAGFGGAGC
ncbi:hypothetical protein AB0C07_20030 [Actinoplanes missouriensis]|uniref:hypothetical protein n=1 Tax=Actinoplanes missouriensis TaxID=1866 RepID=UPI0033E3BAD7